MSIHPPNKHIQRKNSETTSEPKKYKCPESGCDGAFTRNQALEAHMLWHTGEKPYACSLPDCGRSYRRPFELRRHMKEDHKGDKPFVCDGTGKAHGVCNCGREFRRKARLNQHLASARLVNVPFFTPPAQPMPLMKRRLSTGSMEAGQIDGQPTAPQAYGESSIIASPTFEQIARIRGETASPQTYLSVADIMPSSPRKDGVISTMQHLEDAQPPSSPNLEYQSEDQESPGSSLAGMMVIDRFHQAAEVDEEEQADDEENSDGLILAPKRCLRCHTPRCHFTDYSADRVLDHKNFKLSNKSLVLICLHQGCSLHRVDWSALVHHQLEHHAQDFLDKSGITAAELAGINFNFGIFGLGLTGGFLPALAEVTIQGIVDNILNSVRLTVEGLMRQGIEIDLEAFYAKLASRIRRVEYSGRSDLGKKVEEIAWGVLGKCKQEGIRLRDEQEAETKESLWREYETYRKRHLEGTLHVTELLLHTEHFWSCVDSIDGEEARTIKARQLIGEILDEMRGRRFGAMDSRRRLTMQWLEETLNAVIAAREFTPSLHSGETDRTSEFIHFGGFDIAPHSTQQLIQVH